MLGYLISLLVHSAPCICYDSILSIAENKKCDPDGTSAADDDVNLGKNSYSNGNTDASINK